MKCKCGRESETKFCSVSCALGWDRVQLPNISFVGLAHIREDIRGKRERNWTQVKNRTDCAWCGIKLLVGRHKFCGLEHRKLWHTELYLEKKKKREESQIEAREIL